MANDQLLDRLTDHIQDQILNAYYQQQEDWYEEMMNEEPPYVEDN